MHSHHYSKNLSRRGWMRVSFCRLDVSINWNGRSTIIRICAPIAQLYTHLSKSQNLRLLPKLTLKTLINSLIPSHFLNTMRHLPFIVQHLMDCVIADKSVSILFWWDEFIFRCSLSPTCSICRLIDRAFSYGTSP